MSQSYRLKISRTALKLKVAARIPAQLAVENFLTITRANGVYTFGVDYTVLSPGPITDPTKAYIAIDDQTAGIYRTVSLSSLLTSGLDADLQAIAALTGTGILARTADGTWALRTLTAPAAGITITNPAGVAGNPTLVLANDLAAVEGLASNGMAARTATDTWAVRTITAGASVGVTNGDGVSGNPTIAVTDAELAALAGLTSAADRLPYFTGSGTASLATFTSFARTLVDDADQAAMRVTLALTPGTDVQAFDADLAALAANSTDGLWAHTGAGTGAARTLTAPAAGITITNPAGIAGNPTLVLANDLAAVEGLASTGIARRTGTDAWSVGTTVSVAEGGTGLTAGTSGGIPYYSSTSAITSSALLTQFGPVYGGGAGASPVAMSAGTDGQMIVGQTGAAPLWKTMSGDITASAAGAFSIGATKVTSAMLNADVFSTAHSWAGQQTFVAPILGTPASGLATNLTGLPIATGVSGLGTNIATALQFQLNTVNGVVGYNGALGTPVAGTATNLIGLPLSGLTNQAAYTLVGNFTGSSAAPTASTIPALTHKAAPATTDKIVIADSAASDALKYATLAEAIGAVSSGVVSLNTKTGAVVWSAVKQSFTASGTYTPTTNMVYCIIECYGGGGGGGGATSTAATSTGAGGGGGAGSWATLVASAATIGASKTVTIGAAGAAGTNGPGSGGAGGDTSVGTLCIGKGGSGGLLSSGGSPVLGGLGGIAGTGDRTGTGAPGGTGAGSGLLSVGASSGNGGSSALGGGGRSISSTTAAAGEAGTGYGSGGSGASSFNGSGAVAGGAGTAGFVIITEVIVT